MYVCMYVCMYISSLYFCLLSTYVYEIRKDRYVRCKKKEVVRCRREVKGRRYKVAGYVNEVM